MEQKNTAIEKYRQFSEWQKIQEVNIHPSDQGKLRALLNLLPNPEYILTSVAQIQVTVRGNICRFLDAKNGCYEMEIKLDDTAMFPTDLDPAGEYVRIHGSHPSHRTLEEVLQELPDAPEAVWASISDLEAKIKDEVRSLAAFITFEKKVAWLQIDLEKDLEEYVDAELDLLIAPLQGCIVTPEAVQTVRSFKTDVVQYLRKCFPIETPKLESISKNFSHIIENAFTGEMAFVGLFLEPRLTNPVFPQQPATPSLLVKLHEHPSNRAAIVKKAQAGVKK